MEKKEVNLCVKMFNHFLRWGLFLPPLHHLKRSSVKRKIALIYSTCHYMQLMIWDVGCIVSLVLFSCQIYSTGPIFIFLFFTDVELSPIEMYKDYINIKYCIYVLTLTL